jgi:CHAD domain-containing protein
MATTAGLKPNKNFRENARLFLPILFDDFLSYRSRVVPHPRLKDDLHRMRNAGKMLRYAMEFFEDAFDVEFSLCLKEVKQLLDLMGQVHDCDVNIPALNVQLREIRSFNRATVSPGDRIRTKALVDLIRAEQHRRLMIFNDACAVIARWDAENFRQRVVQSMSKV